MVSNPWFKAVTLSGFRSVGWSLRRGIIAGLAQLLITIGALTAVSANAYGEPPEALQPLISQLASIDTLTGDFTQEKTLEGLATPLESRGEFSFSRTDGLVWTITQPIETTLLITPEGIVQKQQGNEVFRLDANTEPFAVSISQILFAVFAGDWSTLQQYFELTPQGDGKKWTLVLVPSNDLIAAFASKITLQGGQYLRELTIDERSGDRTHIQLHHVSGH